MSVRAMKRTAAVVAALGGTLLTVGTGAGQASAATARPLLATYPVWATNVNVRESTWDPTGCSTFPSVAGCPDIQGQAQPGDKLDEWCQRIGQNVGGNPYWVNVFDENNGATGWMASYYIAYPGNRLPNVPDCA